jgi:hypothetical protein
VKRKILWAFLAIVLVIVLYFAYNAGLMALFVIHQRQPQQTEPVYSPSRELVIEPIINTSREDMTKYLCIKMVIRDAETGNILWEKQTSASSRMGWSVQWINEDLIQLQSSDVGDSCWARENDGTWQEASCLQY